MGRGRQKAKQTKVARDLKYYSPETNYSQLERELRGGGNALGTTEKSPSGLPDDSWIDDDDEGDGYVAAR